MVFPLFSCMGNHVDNPTRSKAEDKGTGPWQTVDPSRPRGWDFILPLEGRVPPWCCGIRSGEALAWESYSSESIRREVQSSEIRGGIWGPLRFL